MTSLVSILIPAYNAESWIAETLCSALAQTHPSVEIIVVNDGSTDGTLAQARDFAQRGVQVVTQPNAGAAAARNHALRLARGDFIQYLDADDLLAPDKIATQLSRLTNDPSHIAAGPWGRFRTDISTAIFAAEDNWCDLSSIDWLRLNFSGRGMMPPAAWLTPRAQIDAAGPWDETLSLNDDGEYFCRVLLTSDGVAFCPNARSFYRSGLSGSLSQTHSAEAWNSALRSQIASCDHLISHDSTPASRQACADLHMRLAHSTYLNFPNIAAEAERLSRSYGGSGLLPGGGTLFRLMSTLFGWKTAKRAQEKWSK